MERSGGAGQDGGWPFETEPEDTVERRRGEEEEEEEDKDEDGRRWVKA